MTPRSCFNCRHCDWWEDWDDYGPPEGYWGCIKTQNYNLVQFPFTRTRCKHWSEGTCALCGETGCACHWTEA